MPGNGTYSGHTDKQDRIERVLGRRRERPRRGKQPFVSDAKLRAWAVRFTADAVEARKRGDDFRGGAPWKDVCDEFHLGAHEVAGECEDQLNREFSKFVVRPDECLFFDAVALVKGGDYIYKASVRNMAGVHISWTLQPRKHVP